MRTGIRNITSESPIKEIWKHLHFLLDVKSVSETIHRIQHIPKSKSAANIKKQARQIGYCIRQAEEYFRASSQVGLATRPTLIYYGAVSLSRALTLLKKDGTYSIDALRKNQKHNHHGLDLHRGTAGTIRPSYGAEAFFNLLQCSVYTRKIQPPSSGKRKASRKNHSPGVSQGTPGREKTIPWGSFPLFYQSLVPCTFFIDFEARDHGKSTFIKGVRPEICADFLQIDTLLLKPLNALAILKTLPDMYFALSQFGVQPNLSRGSLKLQITRYWKTSGQRNRDLQRTKEEYHFFIDGISPDEKSRLLAHYKALNPLIRLEADLGRNIHLRLTDEFFAETKLSRRYFPDIVDDINRQKFYILRPEVYLPEPAAQLALLYCLGMLSRYYPDIWIKAIDENVQIAELTDSLLNVIYRKFPNLVLDQLTSTKYYVHS